MGLLKTAGSTLSKMQGLIFEGTPEESQRQISISEKEATYAKVPVDLFHFFGVPMTNSTDDVTMDRLSDINEYLKDKGSMGSKMAELQKIERKLGSTHATEHRHNRVWNHIRLSYQIKDLEKRRDSLTRSTA